MGGDARESLAPPKRATKKEKKENVRDGAFVDDDAVFGVAPFAVPRGALPRDAVGAVNAEFELTAPSARRNAARVLRAMQLTKPILLEGSPGVGKTSLISALAKAAGHRLTRVNLSEQTDMMDLLGADLPADGGGAGEFRWADGAFLGALKRGDWVLLDELNLAPQPVLEGLNAALDHRAEVFVPELGETFRCPPTFRVFAAQNPTQEGGGRKGLPKSFLNRFTRVHVEPMEKTDMAHITTALFPAIPASAAERAVAYVASLADAAKAPGGSFARAGAPWEFNLRDVLRWCELAGDRVSRKSRDRGRSDGSENTVTEPESDEDNTKNLRIVAEALRATRETIFSRRLRRASDRRESARLFREAFAGVIDENVDDVLSVENDGPIAVTVDDGVLRVGGAVLATRRLGDGSSFSKDENSFDEKAKTFLKTSPSRRAYLKPAVLRGQTGALEAAAHCASRGWMTILVGPPASGKTSVAQVLADLAGRTLRRVALTAATDTSELLGSFEQKEPSRDRAALEASVTETLRVAAATALDGYSDPKAQKTLLDVLERAWSRWSAYRSVVDAAEARGAAAEDATAAAEALRAAVDALAEARAATRAATRDGGDAMDVDEFTKESAETGDTAGSTEGVDSVVESIRERLALLGPEAWGGAAPSAGRFEWVDGVLLQAATNGEWVLLENANLCSPTVLDRLNPLLETGGSLLVSECGHGADGEPRVVRAHPEFRLFLALDPRRGEVSRAMRNRGVEVFMDASEATNAREAEDFLSEFPLENARDFADATGDASLAASSSRDDLEGILAAAGVPAGAVRRAMADAHLALVTGDCVEAEPLTSGSAASVETEEARRLRVARARGAAAARFAQLTHREAKTWAALTLELLSRGVGAEAALRRSWTHVYARGEASEQARRFARIAFATRVKPFVDATRRGFDGFDHDRRRAARSTLIEPLGWPDSVAGEATADVAARARRAGALLETVAGTLAGRERAESDDELTLIPNLALAAFPLRALRRRFALGEESHSSREDAFPEMLTDASRKKNGVVSADASAFDEANSSESTRLLHLLRASGHAFLCGVAHGARGGLTRDALRDSAAWLRRLARRFEEPLSKPKTFEAKNQGDFERDFLGVSAELQALARAAEALAAHDVTTSEEEPRDGDFSRSVPNAKR